MRYKITDLPSLCFQAYKTVNGDADRQGDTFSNMNSEAKGKCLQNHTFSSFNIIMCKV